MAIERGQGNLLQADVDALVNTVNVEGVMGKGIALQFKKAFPENFSSYERACKAGEVRPGRMHIVRRIVSPRFIINFPTKKHWRHPSKIEYVRDGLRDLLAKVQELGIRSIAIPPLGCGNGGLDWAVVRPLIVQAFENLPDVRVVLFEPSGAPPARASPKRVDSPQGNRRFARTTPRFLERAAWRRSSGRGLFGEAPAREIIDRRAKPAMTEARAAVVALMGQYLETGYDYRLSLLEVQKLAYFLQEAGQYLRLAYRPYFYGPYADDLRKALRNIEGHYTRGIGDGRNSPETPLELLPNAVTEARAFLANHPDSQRRLERVAELIAGFETPLGMELLGTVHWVMKHDANADDLDDVVAKVHSWSERKRSQMKDGQIRAAWKRLRETGWVEAKVAGAPPAQSRWPTEG